MIKSSRRNKESLVLGPILKKVAPRLHAKVFLEPVWGIAGQITFKNGRRSYFRYNSLDLNNIGSADIAKDKDYANFFMKNLGYPVIPHSRTFFSEEWARTLNINNRGVADACRYAKRIKFPVVVKPNSGSQGVGVSFAHNKQELERALRQVFTKDKIALVQKVMQGKDYRIVVLDNKIISAYERIPLNVVGNGKSTLRELLKIKQEKFIKERRDTRINLADPRIKEKLIRQRMTLASVPKKGKVIYLLDNANLSTGGDSIDVTRIIHNDFKKIAVKLTRDMNLRLCGVDVIIDGTITEPAQKYWILEINAAPGLDHYAKLGEQQAQIVEDLYFEILKALEKK